MAKAKNDYVIGRNSVRELLRHSPSRVRVLLLGQSFKQGDSDIVNLAKKQGISIEFRYPDDLTELVRSDSHQGCVAQVSERRLVTIDSLTGEMERGIVLAIDAIEDPGNFGSILRAAECFGAKAAIFSKNRGVGITPAVTKSAVGATEILPLIEVSNLANALLKLKELGFWLVASDVSPDAQSLNEFEFPEKTVLVIGAEGEGIQDLILRRADFRVYIPQYGAIDSLNASQASAVFLSHYRKQYAE